MSDVLIELYMGPRDGAEIRETELEDFSDKIKVSTKPDPGYSAKVISYDTPGDYFLYIKDGVIKRGRKCRYRYKYWGRFNDQIM